MLAIQMDRTRQSIRNISMSFVAQIINTVLSFVTRTVFISTLGASYLGINGLFSNILTLLSLTELGLDTAMNFKLYKPLAENDRPRLRVLMKFYRTAYLVIGLSFLILGFLLMPFLQFLIKDFDSFETIGVNPYLVFGLYLLQSATSYLFSASKAAIIHADQKSYIVTAVNVIINILRNIAQIVSLVVFQNFIIYTIILIVAGILQNITVAIIAKKQYPDVFVKTDESMDKSEIKDMFKDLGALFVYRVNSVVLKATDNLVLSRFLGLLYVGLYSNYYMFYNTIIVFLTSIYNSLKASMGNLYATADIDKKYKFFEIMNFVSVVLYGTAGIGIAICSNEVVECWIGADYIIKQPLSILIGIEILLVGIRWNLGQIRNIVGLYRQMWYRPVIGMVLNIVVSIALVNVWGISGVIIGTISADFFSNFLIDPRIIYKHYFNYYKPLSSYYIKNITYFIILGIIGVLDFELCKYVYPGHGWPSAILHIMICGISTPTILMLVFRKKHETIYVNTQVRKIIKKLHFSR